MLFFVLISGPHIELEEVCSGMLLHASVISREQIEEAHELLF